MIGLDPITPPKGICDARATASTPGRLATRSICSRRVLGNASLGGVHRLDLIGLQEAAPSCEHVDAGRVGGAGNDDICAARTVTRATKLRKSNPAAVRSTRASATWPVASTACPMFARRRPNLPAAGALASFRVRTKLNTDSGMLNTDSGMLNTDFGHRERSSVA